MNLSVRAFFHRAQAYRRKMKRWVGAYLRYLLYKIKYKNPGSPARELLLDVSLIRMSIDDRRLSKKGGVYRKIYRSVNTIVDDLFLKHATDIEKADDKLEGFYERFELGLNWKDTVLFKGYSRKLEEGCKVQGCYDLDEIVELYESKYDDLYEKIKVEGVRSSRGNVGITPIFVYIDEGGEFVYTSGGNHRLNLARVIGVKKIPVFVKARHIRWQRIRDEICILGEEEFKEKYPHLGSHPDLF